uniref:Carausicin n=1 Tax=Carausius morosus TaxID=7022 RepID=A0A1W5W845_CARMO|nr:carausicin [Carausius morosus]
MQIAVLILAAGLALCAAAPYYQLPDEPSWPQDADATYTYEPDFGGYYEQVLAQGRARRSLQPGAPQFPTPGGQPGGNNNGVDVSVTRERGVGTVVDAQGRGNVWRSQDGNTRVDAHGRWTRVYDGPAHGQRSHSAGVVFSHRWR